MRCKMILESFTRRWETDKGGIAVFVTQYDPTIPEDRRFSEATPSGRAEFVIDNPRVVASLKVGAAYYLDILPCDPRLS